MQMKVFLSNAREQCSVSCLVLHVVLLAVELIQAFPAFSMQVLHWVKGFRGFCSRVEDICSSTNPWFQPFAEGRIGGDLEEFFPANWG